MSLRVESTRGCQGINLGNQQTLPYTPHPLFVGIEGVHKLDVEDPFSNNTVFTNYPQIGGWEPIN